MAGLEIRNGREDDIEELIRVDKEAFSDDWFLSKDYFQVWLEVFPEGLFVACLDGKQIGYASVEIIEHDIKNPIPNWYEATDNGFIRKTHNPSGNTIYGVSIAVSRYVASLRIGKRLMNTAIVKFVRDRNLKHGVVGSRIPGYYKVCSEMTAEEYVNKHRRNGWAIDPLVAFYQRCSFRIVKVLPNYIEDPFSLNWGVLMVFDNPNYKESKPDH